MAFRRERIEEENVLNIVNESDECLFSDNSDR
jgi:hypothetical protein